MTDILEVVSLSVPENSTSLVRGGAMCEHAKKTGLQLILESELRHLQPQKASVSIIPYFFQNELRFALLESFAERHTIRPMEVAADAGWSPKCPWLFKR